MPGDVELPLAFDPQRGVVVWMLGAFLVTFAATRTVTRMIRAGRGPFGNAVVGSGHVHHQVYGIFLMLAAAGGEFVYQPDPPLLQVFAVMFACGAALTLDEFALWLHLEDVYWSREGRKSVDAVLVTAVIGGLLLLGANPFDDRPEQGAATIAVTVAANVAFSVVAIAKGKTSAGLIGIFVPLLALVVAVRLAKPSSPWARWFYAEGSRRLARSRLRFPPGQRTRWDAVLDAVGGAPQS